MSAELPVVVTDCGGPGEILGEPPTGGIQVPVQNATALTEAMQQVQTMSEQQRRAMGKAGRARIQHHFSQPVIIECWEGIYHSLQEDGLREL